MVRALLYTLTKEARRIQRKGPMVKVLLWEQGIQNYFDLLPHKKGKGWKWQVKPRRKE